MAEESAGREAGAASANGQTEAEARQLVVPLGGVTAGRLKVRAGARIRLRVDRDLPDLCHAHFEAPAPDILVRQGEVTIQHRHLLKLMGDLVRERGHLPGGEIVLNGTIPWEIQIRGGLRDLTGDLSQLSLTRLEIGGGASNVDLTLPRPHGTVQIRLRGGASGVSLHRPPDVAARFTVSGVVRNLALDEQKVETVGIGRTRLESPGYEAAADRYEISTTGGVNNVTVDSRQ